MVLALLLASLITLAFNIQPVKAEGGTIYIRADGSVDPPSAPITNVGNVYYTLTADIYDSIVVERDNIVVDGAGYALEGAETGNGILLNGRSNVTIKSITVREFDCGICLNCSSGNILSANTTANNNGTGIDLTNSSYNGVSANNITNSSHNGIGSYFSSSNNSITGNNIINHYRSIELSYSSSNLICHNNFVGNTARAHVYPFGYMNTWDDGYPSGGNYWSDYNGTDNNGDGIGDTQYVIDANNADHYPLMSPPIPIIPEFPAWTILPILMIATLFVIAVKKKDLFPKGLK